MSARSNDLCGIVNGLDYDEYCPFKDTRIAKRFTADTFRKNKVSNKLSLQEELGLDKDPKVMMLGIVSRLTDQKGFDLIDYVMDELCQDAVQIVVLGTGEANMRICSAILHGNIRIKYRPIFSIQRICRIRSMHLQMHF